MATTQMPDATRHEEKIDSTAHSDSQTSSAPQEASDHDTSHLSANGLWQSHDHNQLYTNNLLWTVGLLELSNALDFPANVFNDIPTPLFAQILMGLGGSIAILWSINAFVDLRRSSRNIAVLWTERQFLKSWQTEFNEEDTLDARRLVQAILDVNYRELGWELIDRVLMDVCAGISGVTVGTGCLMAIRGDVSTVYTVSNLLSGYIGNSFLAPFALANTIWAVIMWRRAGVSRYMISTVRPEINIGLRRHGRQHKLYASLNGLTAFVGTVGSIVSSTLWYGYVLIIPCVFTSIFCNLFWRFKLGYNRSIVCDKHCVRAMDITKVVPAVIAATKVIGNYDSAGATPLSPDHASILASYLHELCKGDATIISQTPAEITANLFARPDKQLRLILRDHERYLLELYGRYLRTLELSVVKEHEKD